MEPNTWMLEWHDGMSVGIAEADEDHRRFIALINGLNRAITEHMGLSEIRLQIRLIVSDAEQHFAQEEALFLRQNYPHLDTHASMHEQIRRGLGRIMSGLTDQTMEAEWIAMILMMKGLLVDHLMVEDMKYRDYYATGEWR